MDLHVARRGSGAPLLLIQGMSGTHLSWGDPFVDALAPDFDTIAYDHRGIGLSPKTTDPFTIADLAEDAVGVLDAAGIDTAHVLGISMGGMVAQELALAHPDRVRTLTLGCTYCGGAGSSLMAPDDLQRLTAATMSGDRELALRTGYELNTSDGFRAEDPEERYAAFKAMALAAPARVATIMLQMQAIAQHDTRDRLPTLTPPTLVIHGTADRMLPVANGELIADLVPDARLELLEGVGHMFWWERPEQAAALVAAHAAGA